MLDPYGGILVVHEEASYVEYSKRNPCILLGPYNIRKHVQLILKIVYSRKTSRLLFSRSDNL